MSKRPCLKESKGLCGMIDKKTNDRILSFVQVKPRTVQEIAHHIGRNWRTAEAYIERIAQETGLLNMRTFREGTRGALKIVYWNAIDVRASTYQERLSTRILQVRRKEEFSAFDIFQFATDGREATYSSDPAPPQAWLPEKLLKNAKHHAFILSGNLSWIAADPSIKKVIEARANAKLSLKILTRVDVISAPLVDALMQINMRVGWDAIEVRHCEQPLRGIVVDDTCVVLKEVLSVQMHRELKKEHYLYLRLTDPQWVAWTVRVFWKLWEQSVLAKTRLDALYEVTKKERK